ncbi:hypothetical protein [Sulfobacillus harzensis]|uniref:Uncharacterized protein n=1 Tax=Sulfobacillus harzensis TaxID=2729629 RepID=A0A7Y0L0B3_9FIRM|nr:hypothetical protein [Sulfobacillus harzensis]NMP20875.1 hypothetical protein [Sulfobacillus harzensis]
MEFGRDFLGYRRADVDAAIERLEKQRDDQAREIDALRTQVSQLMQAREVDQVTIASLRRTIGELTRDDGVPSSTVTLLIGPLAHLADVVDLVDELKQVDALSIRFQVFRDGFYRVDGYVSHRGLLLEWLQMREEVTQVRQEKDTIYVSLKGPSL